MFSSLVIIGTVLLLLGPSPATQVDFSEALRSLDDQPHGAQLKDDAQLKEDCLQDRSKAVCQDLLLSKPNVPVNETSSSGSNPKTVKLVKVIILVIIVVLAIINTIVFSKTLSQLAKSGQPDSMVGAGIVGLSTGPFLLLPIFVFTFTESIPVILSAAGLTILPVICVINLVPLCCYTPASANKGPEPAQGLKSMMPPKSSTVVELQIEGLIAKKSQPQVTSVVKTANDNKAQPKASSAPFKVTSI